VKSTPPTQSDKRAEIPAAMLFNKIMFALLLLAFAAFYSWDIYREIALSISDHGAHLSKHLKSLFTTVGPILALLVLAHTAWRPGSATKARD
jgi:uncharacterized protein YaaW (UPF0174 family)